MSQHQSKETLTRLAWLAALRQQGERQCRGMYITHTGQVCALGMLAEVTGYQGDWEGYRALAPLAGLSDHHVRSVISMNDGNSITQTRPHTFAEIADVVSSWFPS